MSNNPSLRPAAADLAMSLCKRIQVASSSLLAVMLLVTAVQGAERPYGGAPDPEKVVGVDTCAKCHTDEVRVWRQTPHSLTFDRLHRSAEAKQIAKRLGLRSVKRNDACTNCHYTSTLKGSKPRVVAGVTCESCHGGAKDWVDKHYDYGGPNVTAQSETPEHRQQRIQTSIDNGMNNPNNIYLIARQCLACHSTPSEQIVNVGGHVPGSLDFNLVSWSQGIVRHNFRRSGNNTNVFSSPERLRVMYLVGMMADLEASLRAVSKATADSTYARSAAGRAARAKGKLWEAQRILKHPILGQALNAVASIELTLDNGAELEKAAKQVGEVALRFSSSENGASLAAIDSMLPPRSAYKN